MVGLIWATRGRSWGFRFLLKAGYADPLPVYERAFADVQDAVTACQRVHGRVALRFLDPLQREDDAGRIIPHDFVVFTPQDRGINSVDDGIKKIWPVVASIYARVWTGEPPSATALQSVIDGDLGDSEA